MSTASTSLVLDSSLDPESQTARARAELRAIETELQRRRWLASPALWVRERLGLSLWSMQEQILESVAASRRVAVRSCHEAGKSFNAGLAVCWWIDCHRPGEAFVVTSAPTGSQVKAILWREIGRTHTIGKLPGRTNLTEWYIPIANTKKDELVAFGRKPSDMDPTAFQGIHARFVLVVFDEACGMPQALWTAADSLIANDGSRILAIGNPDDASSEFSQICKPGSGWSVLGISAFDTPNFSGEPMPSSVLSKLVGKTWVEEKRRAWAPSWSWVDEAGAPVDFALDPVSARRCVPPAGFKQSDMDALWASKILGVFPSGSSMQSLIPQAWIEAAMERDFPPLPQDADVLGIDCGAGGDSSTTCHRRGSRFRIISEDRNPNTMQTTGKILEERRRVRAAEVRVDKIGIGAGIFDRLVEQVEGTFPPEFAAFGINSGESPHDPSRFANFRAEAWWHVRERFESGEMDIDPADVALAVELASLRYKRTSSGKIQIESKDEAKRRGIASPNRADSLMFAACTPLPPEAPKPVRKGGLLW